VASERGWREWGPNDPQRGGAATISVHAKEEMACTSFCGRMDHNIHSPITPLSWRGRRATPSLKMRLAVGTYEGSLIGWESDLAADASGRTLALAYAFSAHDASVKAVAFDEGAGATLVTGSSDETMKLYNVRARREVGSLLEHRDAVTAVEFFGAGSMLSGDHAGAICIWRASDWTALHTMTGHKCVCVAAHRDMRGNVHGRRAAAGTAERRHSEELPHSSLPHRARPHADPSCCHP